VQDPVADKLQHAACQAARISDLRHRSAGIGARFSSEKNTEFIILLFMS
jgi:hypothetical protein